LMQGFDLSGKVAIISGGNGGLGRGIAIGLAKAGADIVIAARNEEKTARVIKEIKSLDRQCVGTYCDVTAYDDIKASVKTALREFGGLNILVNNAGVAQGVPPQSMSEDEWDWVIDTNLKGTFRFCQAAYPELARSGSGKIINIGSQCASSYMTAHYSASKGGVLQMTKSLALAWAKDNIQVNAIIPGWFRTDLTAPVFEHEAFYRGVVGRTPAGRFGEPEELAGVAIFLASQMSDYVTGEGIVVDGGYSLMM